MFNINVITNWRFSHFTFLLAHLLLMKWSRFINFAALFHRYFAGSSRAIAVGNRTEFICGKINHFHTSSDKSRRAIQRLTYNLAIIGASTPAFALIIVKFVPRQMSESTFIGARDLLCKDKKNFSHMFKIILHCLWKCWHCEIDSKRFSYRVLTLDVRQGANERQVNSER